MSEQTVAPQSIVELLDLRHAVQAAARTAYQAAIGTDSDYPVYDDLPVAKRRQMENGILPLVCAIAGPIAKTAFAQGRDAGSKDYLNVMMDPDAQQVANPYEDATNPFERNI